MFLLPNCIFCWTEQILKYVCYCLHNLYFRINNLFHSIIQKIWTYEKLKLNFCFSKSWFKVTHFKYMVIIIHCVTSNITCYITCYMRSRMLLMKKHQQLHQGNKRFFSSVMTNRCTPTDDKLLILHFKAQRLT